MKVFLRGIFHIILMKLVNQNNLKMNINNAYKKLPVMTIKWSKNRSMKIWLDQVKREVQNFKNYCKNNKN